MLYTRQERPEFAVSIMCGNDYPNMTILRLQKLCQQVSGFEIKLDCNFRLSLELRCRADRVKDLEFEDSVAAELRNLPSVACR